MTPLLFKLGLSVASVVAVLLLAEVALRILPAPAPPPMPHNARKQAILAKEPGLPVYRSVTELAAPNSRGIYRGQIHRTNRHGIRGPDYTSKPSDDVFRIAIVGDSVTAGSGVAEEAAYAAQLEARLNAGSAGARYEVINAGLGGINARMVMDRLSMVLRSYQPDLVVYGFTINDIEGAAYVNLEPKEGAQGFIGRIRRFDRSPSLLLRTLWPRLMGLLDRTSPTSYSKEIHYNYFENPGAWNALDSQLQRFAQLTKRADVCGLVMIHTQLAQLGFMHPFEGTYARVGDALTSHGVPVVQTFPAHDGLHGFDYWVAPSDPHPNRAGHEILANALLEGLRQLPAACWRTRGKDFRPAG